MVGMQPEEFGTAVENGDVVDRDGYHQPQSSDCGCDKTTGKGAHRDVTVDMPDGRTIHFYHQSPIVVEDSHLYAFRVSSCGHQTSSTKRRINSHLPEGYSVVQEDSTWYLERPERDHVEFEDGMVVDP